MPVHLRKGGEEDRGEGGEKGMDSHTLCIEKKGSSRRFQKGAGGTPADVEKKGKRGGNSAPGTERGKRALSQR